MKATTILLFANLFWMSNVSADLNRGQYSKRYNMQSTSSPYWSNVSRCLGAWGNHPFRNKASIRFRLMGAKVRVFGLGDNISDYTNTSYPQLIYIKPAVNVMSKTTYVLKNPNGWYCFESKVNVMGKSIIRAGCKTHIATTKGDVVVLGRDRNTKGTTVLGKSLIYRDCKR